MTTLPNCSVVFFLEKGSDIIYFVKKVMNKCVKIQLDTTVENEGLKQFEPTPTPIQEEEVVDEQTLRSTTAKLKI